jgi:hypothetical protein
MTSRWVPRAALAAGALASIATSAPTPEWSLSSGKSLPPSVLDQVPSITYPIQIQLEGEQAYVGLEGWITATIRVVPQSTPPPATTVTVRLRSLSASYASDETTISFENAPIWDTALQVPAWDECNETPCVEDFVLEIVRSETVEPTIYDVSGSIEIDASGTDPMSVGSSDLALTIGAPR